MNIDKNTVLQIFGSLMKQPSLLAEVDRYILSPSDFSNSFEQYVFGAIYNLYANGAEKVTVVDVDNYLSNREFAYKTFNSNNGIEYLQDAEDLASVENFDYYYRKLKKLNAINELKRAGYPTSKLYPENLLDADYEKKLEAFENMSIGDIFDFIKREIAKTEDKYTAGASKENIKANEGIESLIAELRISPEIGFNLQGEIFNTIVRGARRGKYYIRSAGTGVGKSRGMVADASYLAYPIRYDSQKRKWVHCGSCEKILYIATEQKPEEIQTMILAYLTDMNEEKILFGRYTDEEEIILKQAIEVMNRFADNFIIAQLPNPSMEQIKSTIRKYNLVDEVDYVFYDYIFSSPALLAEFKGTNVREDVVLLMLSTMLKDLAVELDVFMMSATQLNAEADKQAGVKNQGGIRGSKAIIDKADMAAIVSRISQEELRTLDVLIKKTGVYPNIVTDIYKLRRGRYTNVRIWSHMDLGTLRKTDLFLTDGNYNEIEDFVPNRTVFELDDLGQTDEILSFLNDGIVTEEKEEELIRREKDRVIELSDLTVQDNSLFGGLI